MKMKHREKVKLARKLQTKSDKRHKFGLFVGDGWDNHAKAVAKRVQRRIERVQKRKAERYEKQ